MPEIAFSVGVIAERRKVEHPWQDHAWEAVAVLSGVPEVAVGTRLSGDAAASRYYIGAAEIVLATSETGQYRANLLTPPPRLWVVTQEAGDTLSLSAVTADPSEGESYTETGASLVSVVPMPADIAGWVAEFVDAHHVERVFVKRKRKRAEESRGEA